MSKRIIIPNIVAILILVFTVLGLIFGGPKLFVCLTVDLDREFDGTKAYFQTRAEQAKLTPRQLQDYEALGDFQLLKDAADYFDLNETNKVKSEQLRQMICYYQKLNIITPEIYGDLVDYNIRIARIVTWSVVGVVVIAWMAWCIGFYCGAYRQVDGKGLVQSARGIQGNIKSISKKQPQKSRNNPTPPN